MEVAEVTRTTPDPPGGDILRDKAGNATGLFNERAQELIDVAFAEFDENIKGSLKPGKLADVTVFSKDISRSPNRRFRPRRSSTPSWGKGGVRSKPAIASKQ